MRRRAGPERVEPYARDRSGRGAAGSVGAAIGALTACLLTVPAGLGAQEARATIDRGTFELRSGGSVVGSETYEIRRDGGTIRAVGRISLESEAGPLLPAEVWLQADSTWKPQMLRFRPARGDLRQAVAVREGDRLRLQLTTEEGERWKEFMAPSDLSLVDPRVAHHYAFLIRQHRDALQGGGQVSIPAVVPWQRDRVTVRITREGEESVQVGGSSRSAVRHVVRTGDMEARVWAERDGTVLRVEWPGSGVVAVRTGQGGP